MPRAADPNRSGGCLAGCITWVSVFPVLLTLLALPTVLLPPVQQAIESRVCQPGESWEWKQTSYGTIEEWSYVCVDAQGRHTTYSSDPPEKLWEIVIPAGVAACPAFLLSLPIVFGVLLLRRRLAG